ncbi:MAG: alpha/beta hydrolase, partial [Acidimicrobiales bacterium]
MAPLQFRECLVSAEPSWDGSCGPPDAGEGVIDAEGELSGQIQLSARFELDGSLVDCRVEACEIRLGGSSPLDTGRAPLAFDPGGPLAPAPTLAVSPANGLRDGQSVHLHAEHLRRFGFPSVGQCPVGATPGSLLGCRFLANLQVAADATADLDVMVDQVLSVSTSPGEPPTDLDCTTAAGGCEVRLVDSRSGGAATAAPVSFDPNAPVTRYLERAFHTVDVTTGIVYGRNTGPDGIMQDLVLDLYEPHGDTLAARPALLYVHGGFFTSGDRSEGQRLATELAKRGYVVASIDYRLYPGLDVAHYATAIPAALHDAQAAVRWLRADAAARRIAPTAIGSIGYSAGALTSLHLGYLQDDDDQTSGNPGYPSTISAAVSLAGGSVGMSSGAPPALLFSSTDDTTVPYASSVTTCDAAVAAGNRCTLVTYTGAGHAIYQHYDDILAKTLPFLHDTVVPDLALPPPSEPPSTLFHAVGPSRILDSRPGGPQVGPFSSPWGPGTTREVSVAGVGGVPADADAVVLNVTATSTTAASFLSVWPTGGPRPLVSSLNWSAGQTVPNAVTVKVGAGGTVSVFNPTGSVDVVIDVVGWFGAGTGAPFHPVDPRRIQDSRPGGPQVGPYASAWSPVWTRDVQVADAAGIPVGATAAVVNLTVTGTSAAGYLSVWPAGPRPLVSSLNWAAQQTVANAVTAPIGDDGRVLVYNSAGSVDVIADAVGWYG